MLMEFIFISVEEKTCTTAPSASMGHKGGTPHKLGPEWSEFTTCPYPGVFFYLICEKVLDMRGVSVLAFFFL